MVVLTPISFLQGAENNNKPGVKLPSVVQTTSGQSLPLTILEAVIKQTGVYAASRKGRLSVFWGDQVFIPSVTTRYTSQHHADILAQMGPMPSKAEWEAGGYSNYGLIATGSNGEGAQVMYVCVCAFLASIMSNFTHLGLFLVTCALVYLPLTGREGHLRSGDVSAEGPWHRH